MHWKNDVYLLLIIKYLKIAFRYLLRITRTVKKENGIWRKNKNQEVDFKTINKFFIIVTIPLEFLTGLFTGLYIYRNFGWIIFLIYMYDYCLKILIYNRFLYFLYKIHFFLYVCYSPDLTKINYKKLVFAVFILILSQLSIFNPYIWYWRENVLLIRIVLFYIILYYTIWWMWTFSDIISWYKNRNTLVITRGNYIYLIIMSTLYSFLVVFILLSPNLFLINNYILPFINWRWYILPVLILIKSTSPLRGVVLSLMFIFLGYFPACYIKKPITVPDSTLLFALFISLNYILIYFYYYGVDLPVYEKFWIYIIFILLVHIENVEQVIIFIKPVVVAYLWDFHPWWYPFIAYLLITLIEKVILSIFSAEL